MIAGAKPTRRKRATANQRKIEDDLREAIYRLPADDRSMVLEAVTEYARSDGKLKQLLLALAAANTAPATAEISISTEMPAAAARRGRRRIAFGWYGGKYSHLQWLLPLLPFTRRYCEPFGGSAAVLINRPPAAVETYNDLDGEVTNFFRVLRDHTDELVKAIALTPFSREEFGLALKKGKAGLPDVERARRFFVCARQVRTGLAQTASLGRWANCMGTSRAGMSGVVSRWLGSVEGLPGIALRLLRVQIENRPAAEVIPLYDSDETLFYCDPPYMHETRGDSKAYRYEMDEPAHRDLAKVLDRVKGKVALSGYRCALMDDLYRGWRRTDAPPKNCHSVKKPRQEALWTNC